MKREPKPITNLPSHWSVAIALARDFEKQFCLHQIRDTKKRLPTHLTFHCSLKCSHCIGPCFLDSRLFLTCTAFHHEARHEKEHCPVPHTTWNINNRLSKTDTPKWKRKILPVSHTTRNINNRLSKSDTIISCEIKAQWMLHGEVQIHDRDESFVQNDYIFVSNQRK